MALAVIVKYMEQEKKKDSQKVYEFGVDDPQHWNDTADWCQDILEASGRDGHYGCPLCRS